ncbi:MAG: hypothetical protein WAV82_05495 [Methylobacter sp.]
MKFIQSFFISAFVASVVYYSTILTLLDAPVPAEYWVGEMIFIKKELVKAYKGKSKIIVAGGSSTLFGIDADYASKQLGMPVINFGLHAGLRLDKIFKEVSAVVESGDFLILTLEPYYYDCNTQFSAWQVNNIVGWDHDAWKDMSHLEKSRFLSSVSPTLFASMLLADFEKRFYPSAVSDRLATTNQTMVLSRFHSRVISSSFEYSAYQLDYLGDMQQAVGSQFSGQSFDIRKPLHICEGTKNYLIEFVNDMRDKGVRVYFANTPYINSDIDRDEIEKGESGFLKELSSVGVMIDQRKDVFFDRKYFFNTDLHLNTEGRRLRTSSFIKAVRKNVLSQLQK